MSDVTLLSHASLLGGVAQSGVRMLADEATTQPEGMERHGRLDRFGKVLATVVTRAVNRARVLDGPVTGLVSASRYSCFETNATFHYGMLDKGPEMASPLLFPYTLPGSAASEVAMLLGLRGAYLVFPGGPATALAAVLSAVDLIDAGGAERLVVAACDVLGPHTLAHLRDGGTAMPPLAEGAAAAWLAKPSEAGLKLRVEGALGAPDEPLRDVVRQALERAGIAGASLRHLYSASSDAADDQAALAELTPGVVPTALAFRVGDCAAALGMLGFLAATEEPGPSLVVASDKGQRIALVIEAP
jgi:hypothetical protein